MVGVNAVKCLRKSEGPAKGTETVSSITRPILSSSDVISLALRLTFGVGNLMSEVWELPSQLVHLHLKPGTTVETAVLMADPVLWLHL